MGVIFALGRAQRRTGAPLTPSLPKSTRTSKHTHRVLFQVHMRTPWTLEIAVRCRAHLSCCIIRAKLTPCTKRSKHAAPPKLKCTPHKEQLTFDLINKQHT